MSEDRSLDLIDSTARLLYRAWELDRRRSAIGLAALDVAKIAARATARAQAEEPSEEPAEKPPEPLAYGQFPEGY